jgi:hypothetical protein
MEDDATTFLSGVDGHQKSCDRREAAFRSLA